MGTTRARGFLLAAATAGCQRPIVPPALPESSAPPPAPELEPLPTSPLPSLHDLLYVRAEVEPFDSPLETHPGLWVVSAVVELGYGGDGGYVWPSGQVAQEAAHMDPRQLVRAGLPPPPRHVWLVGNEGPCRAKLDPVAWVDLSVDGLPEAAVNHLATDGPLLLSGGVPFQSRRHGRHERSPYAP